MLIFHGTPITPQQEYRRIIKDRHVLFSYFYKKRVKNDIGIALDAGCKVLFDNGAFTYYKQGLMPNWTDYYDWISRYEKRFGFFIPDIIDGSEQENNELLKENCFSDGIPVFHLHESEQRLKFLMSNYDYIALGSSKEFWQVGSKLWFKRMDELMRVICDSSGYPKVKVHMLRCLNPKVFVHFPFYSADSTNLARNHKNPGNSLEKILYRVESAISPRYYKGLEVS